MPQKTWVSGETILATDLNALSQQAVITCTSATRPASPVNGMTIYQTDTNTMFTYNGTAWVASAIPAFSGMMKIIPTGATGGTVGADGTITVSASAQSTVTVNGAFSATFDSYRIIWSGGSVSTSAAVSLILKVGGGANSTTGYYGGLTAWNYSNSAIGGADSNATQFTWAGGGDSGTFGLLNVDIHDPFKAAYTKLAGDVIAGAYAGRYTGVHAVNTSYSDFVLDPFGAATMQGGTIRIYGYRN